MNIAIIITLIIIVGLGMLLAYALCDAAARSDRMIEYSNSMNVLKGNDCSEKYEEMQP